MKHILIKQEFSDDHISRAAGERLRRLILESAAEGGTVTVDFKGVVIASTSFFDEGIAKLALEDWTREKFERFVVLKNMNPRDAKVMEKMCAYRGLGLLG